MDKSHYKSKTIPNDHKRSHFFVSPETENLCIHRIVIIIYKFLTRNILNLYDPVYQLNNIVP